MIEPFTPRGRDAFVRAQQTAALFASPQVGTEHVLFALAGGDDDVAAAIARAVDRDALQGRLQPAAREPEAEMTFTPAVKHGVERAFASARMHGQAFVGTAHLALGMIEAEPPPLNAGITLDALRADLERLTEADDGGNAPPGAKNAG